MTRVALQNCCKSKNLCLFYCHSKETFPRSEGLAHLANQFAEKYEKIGGRSDRKRVKELYSASPD